jgi:hypothetical protein
VTSAVVDSATVSFVVELLNGHDRVDVQRVLRKAVRENPEDGDFRFERIE